MIANSAVLGFALIACLAASSAAADPTTAAATGPAPPQPAATPPKKHGYDPNAVICIRDEQTGTMFAKKVCMTAAQWDQTRQQDVDAVQRMRGVPQRPTGMMGR